MIGGLADFDAPTGFVAGVNSVTATLNNRKEFLRDLEVLNTIGLKQDGFQVTESGTVSIANKKLSAINATLRDRGRGDLTLIPTSTFRRKMGQDYIKLSASDLKLINPSPIPTLLGDKAQQYWEFYEEPIPVVPWQPIDHYIQRSSKVDTKLLKSEFISATPVVVKRRSSTQGKGVWFYPGGITDFIDDWETESAPADFLTSPGAYLLQYAIPHEYDKRVIAAGKTPVSGENRYGSPETDKSNLNIIDTGASSLREAAAKLLEMGAVEPLNMDDLDPAVERAVEDLYASLTNLVDEPATTLYTWIGWDFLVVNPQDERVTQLPAAIRDHIFDARYRTEEGCYLVFGEGNLSPGSKERFVNAIAHGRQGLQWDSAANLLKYGESISRDRTFEPGVPEMLDIRTLAGRYNM